jgi:glycosyltransferase involved in cell wall biosynthesis
MSPKPKGRVLYVGQSFYHAWYLSRELRKLGWVADVLNWDLTEQYRMFYHGEDFRFHYRGITDRFRHLRFYAKSLLKYDIFHFSNAHGMRFGHYVHSLFAKLFREYSEVQLLKGFGKKIVYSTNGCTDGSSQTSFSKWGPENTCAICRWHDDPRVCSDQRNLAWGRTRNSLADYIVTFDYSPTDYNLSPKVHIVPEFYCLDHNIWNPDLLIPANYRLAFPSDVIKIYHSVGDFESRTTALENRNIKCTHIYVPLVERLRREGYKVELIFFNDVPNKKLRYYQAQADIFVDMLTAGWFGANVREAMMLGKPAICFLRPEWLRNMQKQVPGYVEELPVISATPQTAYDALKGLIESPDKRRELGEKGRRFAVKWHSAEAGARRFDRIYSELLRRD